MLSFRSLSPILLDGAIRTAASLKQKIAKPPKSHTGVGDSLPGGQIHLSASIFKDEDGFELLRTGSTKHSMWRTVEWKLLLPIVGNLHRPLLDLGCGDGAFGSLFTQNIDFGVDGDADAVSQCNPQIYAKALVGDLREELPIPEASLSAVFSNSTLEHVKPLAPAIASVARALKPNGKLIATVPTNGLSEAFEAQYGGNIARRINANLGHHNLLPWSQWEDLLKSNGFVDIKFRGYLSRPAVQWYAERTLEPWPQIARRRQEWLWRHDLAEVKHHVNESLRVTKESETTCVLIEATKVGE